MMGRKLARGLAAALIPLCFFSGCGPEYEGTAAHDFRNADWGMSRTRVAKTEEKEHTYASDEVLLYELEENGDALQVFYYFSDDKLVRGECRVMMGDQLTNALVNGMIESYLRFRERVTELYGAPDDDEYKVWLDDEGDKADRDAYNIYFRHLMYRTEWNTETAYMALTFDYNNDVINYLFQAEPAADGADTGPETP